MVEKAIIDVISRHTKEGLKKEQIIKNLTDVGWEMDQINEAYAFFLDFDNPVADKPTSKSKKGLIKILVIVSVFLFLSSSVLGYYYFFLSPGRVLLNMVSNITKVTSFEYSGDLRAVGNANKFVGESTELIADETSDSTINFSGKADISNIKEPKILFAFDISSDLSGAQMNIALELRLIQKKLYINPKNTAGLLEVFGLSSLEGQWIEMDITSSLEESKVSFDVLDLLSKGGKIVKITDTLPSEEIEGVNTFHYAFEIDKEMLKQYLKDLASKNDGDVQDLTDIDHSFESIKSINGEIWIGKKDSFPYKVVLNLKGNDTGDSNSSEEGNLTLNLKNFNQPVVIDIPSESKTFEEIFSENSNLFMTDN